MTSNLRKNVTLAIKGGPGSGFTSEAGHAGRPGKVGGSASAYSSGGGDLRENLSNLRPEKEVFFGDLDNGFTIHPQGASRRCDAILVKAVKIVNSVLGTDKFNLNFYPKTLLCSVDIGDLHGRATAVHLRPVRTDSNQINGFIVLGNNPDIDDDRLQVHSIHELAHYLDSMIGFGLYNHGKNPVEKTAVGTDDFSGVRFAILQSGNLVKLRDLLVDFDALVGNFISQKDIDFYRSKFPLDSDEDITKRCKQNVLWFAQYYTDRKEFFARALTQYIIKKSGNKELMKSLFENSDSKIASCAQWTDEEFIPIEKEFDAVFSRLGMLRLQ